MKQQTRRKFLATGTTIATALAFPNIWIRRASAAGAVVCRSPGGLYGEALTKAIYEPFTKATGIEVVGIAANTAKVLAMVEARKIELDVLDVTEVTGLILRAKNALEPINYKAFKYTNPDDLSGISQPDMCPSNRSANVIVYNTQVFPTGKHPKSWADVWDAKRFPGPRMLQSLDAGFPELEAALLADGVPIDKLYPLDVGRAFASLTRVKPFVAQFYDTGGTQLDMLASKEVVTGSAYNGRIQVGVDKGAPVGIEWNQANVQNQIMGVLKGGPNTENAQRFVDFAFQPQVQAEFAKYIPYGPTNKKAMQYVAKDVAAKLPNNYADRYFLQDSKWWADNRARVAQIWAKWILQKS